MEQRADKTYTSNVPMGAPASNQAWHLFGEIGVYGISLQGSSHIDSETPCQDNNIFSYLEPEGLLIAAVADGVGSCPLSHWGAYTAVNAAVSSLGQGLRSLSGGKPLELKVLPQEQIEELFHTAFRYARDMVAQTAQTQHQPVHLYQSTLTAAVYDGRRLACCHVGDDGIVAQGVSGNYQMITTRIKGEEANSVVTLQSGRWQITVTTTDITGFLMSTDGVLDHYVSGNALGNRVYYPFFEKRIYGMLPQADAQPDQAVRDIFERTKRYLQSDRFQQTVTDDITVLAAANQTLLRTGIHPQFSREEWEKESHRFWEEKQRKLYPNQYTAIKKEEEKQKSPAKQRAMQDTGHPESYRPSSPAKEEPQTWLGLLYNEMKGRITSQHKVPDSATPRRDMDPSDIQYQCKSCGLRIIPDKKKLPDVRDIRCPCCGARLQKNSQQRSTHK